MYEEGLIDNLDSSWDPTEIDALKIADNLIPLYGLLKHILGQDETQFRLRLAVIFTFREAGPFLNINDINRELRWIKETKRTGLISSMRRTGWLNRSEKKGYCLSRLGRQLLRIMLTFLASLTPEDEGTGLSPGTEAYDIQWAMLSRTSPVSALQTLQHELETVAGLIEDALSTDSWSHLYQITDETSNLVRDIGGTRRILNQLQEENSITTRDLTETHRLLSRVLNLHAEMERRLTAYSESFIGTQPGMSPQRIMNLLLEKPIAELADVSNNLIRVPYKPRFFVNPNYYLAEAGNYLSKSVDSSPEIEWEMSEYLVAEQKSPDDWVVSSPPMERLVQILNDLAIDKEVKEIREIFPYKTFAESFLRQAMSAHLASPTETAHLPSFKKFHVKIMNKADAISEGETPMINLEDGPICRISDAKLKVIEKNDK